ncbi:MULTISPECIES: lantibiotic dehydratase family protein [unclassified Chryseobacterium]|uniref:lantibiotic dehydratase family protein n=1 Tax=unclassified Chryseobacterium TaxID=2593645 RepID=UPI000D3A7E9C|nr:MULTISPECIES: lantibiotic dehydratase family protein [unclassified Chryseobacterium]PTT72564.1 lantibiotic dehydratase [Chryseobacterium sp. HMWF001]PVV49964.1 lantibiotic dehydratase [Chryseobacterium sp. HMWF035]
MSRFPYQFFEEFVVRTPLFSCRDFQKTISKSQIPENKIREICSDPIFQEALYLASPHLHLEVIKWLNSEREPVSKDFAKLKNTILKYYSRMSTRCTPFGLFSSVGLGKFSEKSISINKDDKELSSHLIRDTKLDMHFLVSLAQYFEKSQEIRNRLSFYPNNSIYRVGNKIRYIEYQYTAGKREYIISSAPLSEELGQIINFSRQGKTIQQIAEILIGEEIKNSPTSQKQITKEEAEEFIEELIDNQVLVSELEPNVSGDDFFDTILSVLNKINAEHEVQILTSIKKKLEKLDRTTGNPISLYTEIEELIQSLTIDYEQKYLFQTDLYYGTKFTLPSVWKKELKKGICFLNKITLPQKETQLEQFKKAFYERFETQEVPLLNALDTEIGVGYLQNNSAKGIHPYLEDLKFQGSGKKQDLQLTLNSIHRILNEKLQEALLEQQYKIELSDEDFKDIEEENWDDLPATISFMAEIFSEGDQEKMILNGSTGKSAANLLGRFCSEKSEVRDLTISIANKEEALYNDYILAEIIHLPEARIGNIVRRPTLREYEIPFLAQSVVSADCQISVEDLFISIKNNRIVLRSGKLNKEVKPYLTNAHNYYNNTLPVYHFLCDLQSQDIRSGLYFNWGGLEHIYKFLPRVEYNNIVLSKAQWKITEKDLAFLSEKHLSNDQIISELQDWRLKRKIPQWIQLVKSDNTLSINLENDDMVTVFLQTVKTEKTVVIEEFLYNENDDYKREFIFPMYKIK